MKSVRRHAFRALVLVLALSTTAPAQVGGPPGPPATLWSFLGIPQGVRKLRGATSNRRGNNPQREPKPPLKAIADPDNLESPDKSIKKAAEIKQAEDLKKQKIKAVKYLTQIGCGCYDVDGGVTEALVASMGDCTEDVRYETIKAISEAAEGECCAKCGKVCCCNKDILTEMAKIAYERDDTGCYIEPSDRVREAAAEALVICCPNDSPPVIVDEPEETRPERETVDPGVSDPDRESEPSPLPERPDRFEELPSGDSVTYELPSPPEPPAKTVSELADTLTEWQPGSEQVAHAVDEASSFQFGVVVHVSAEHRLAHVHFHNPAVQPAKGSVVGIYQQAGDRRMLLAKLTVVEAFVGSANVTGSVDAFARISRGDVAVRPPGNAAQKQPLELATDSQTAPTTARPASGVVRLSDLRTPGMTVSEVFPASTLAPNDVDVPAQVIQTARRQSNGHRRPTYRGFAR